MTITIALDAMNGAQGVSATAAGAAALSRESHDIHVLVVGDVHQLSPALDRLVFDPSRLTLVHALSVRAGLDSDSVQENAIAAAFHLVKMGQADAVVSAASPEAVVLAAQTLSSLPGISQVALAAVCPTETRRGPHRDPFVLMLDVGASLDASADALVGFAQMGAIYSSIISELAAPKIGLLSHTRRVDHGPTAIQQAHRRLSENSSAFSGNLEGLDILQGHVDIVLCNGLLGRVVLTMLEGFHEVIMDRMRHASSRGLQWRLGMNLLGGGLREDKSMLHWKSYGGSPLLGYERVIISTHQQCEPRAIRNAIRVAAKAVRGDLIGKIRNSLARAGGVNGR